MFVSFLLTAMASSGGASFEQLTRRHGVKVPVGAENSVEEVSLAIGNIVGCDSIRSASRMNGAVVLFLDKIDKVNEVVEKGITLNDSFVKVFPLVNPAKKVLLSNVPPFVKDETIERELSRHGQIVSTIKRIPLGCKSPLLKHVVSFRRQVYMVLKSEVEDLNIVLKFKIDSFDYVIFASTESLKCFGCGKEGHLMRSCPEKETLNDSRPTVERVVEVGNSEKNNTEQLDDGGTNGKESEKETMMEREEVSENIEENTKETQESEEMDLNELEEEQLRDDETIFKVPTIKRKTNQCEVVPKSKKKMQNSDAIKEVEACGESYSADEVSGSDSEKESFDAFNNVKKDFSGYSLEKMRSFLQSTKGKRNVEVTDYFPDRMLFIESARVLMRERGDNCLSNPDVYRLKKIVQRLSSQLRQNESDQMVE